MEQKTIDIAWTFDDGPTEHTQSLIEQLKARNITQVTWFVSRLRVQEYNYFEPMLQLEKTGSEIAIHEIHSYKPDVNWLPVNRSSYESVDQAMKDLSDFHAQLQYHGITTKFVRLPGGEFSEIVAYLNMVGCPFHRSHHWAMRLIDNRKIPAKFKKVKQDYQKLLTFLKSLNLKIWSGASADYPLLGGGSYLYNSWQAESSGISVGRGADNVTNHQSPSRRHAGIIEENSGLFEDYLYEVKEGMGRRSIVILAHDTTPEDLDKIITDIDYMEMISKENNISINYCTLSSLFEKLRA